MEAKCFRKHESVFNHYVASHPQGDVLQTTHWGKLKAATGWRYFPLAVVESGQIQAAALILQRGWSGLGVSLFYSPRGPLYSNGEAFTVLTQAVRELARQEKALCWKMDPPIPYGDPTWTELAADFRAVPTGLDFDGVQPKFIMELDIRRSADELLAAMKSKTRYNIRYAKRKDVRVRLARSKQEIEIFYPLLQETAKRDGFVIRSQTYFEDLWDALVKQNLAQFFLAYHDEEPLGGAVAFRLGRRAWYVYGASSSRKRNLQASYALQWEMIRWAKGSGCHVYDFRGVSGDVDPDHPLYGLYRFKDGFGAKVVEYVGEFDCPCSKAGYLLWRKLFPVYQSLTRKQKR